MTAEDLLPTITRLGKRYMRLRDELAAVAIEMQPLMLEAIRDGVAPPITLVSLTGYSRDHIRVLCREAGIRPLRAGRQPRAGGRS